MLSIELFLVTFTLAILSVIAIRIEMYKSIIPLGIIYFIFLIIHFSKNDQSFDQNFIQTEPSLTENSSKYDSTISTEANRKNSSLKAEEAKLIIGEKTNISLDANLAELTNIEKNKPKVVKPKVVKPKVVKPKVVKPKVEKLKVEKSKIEKKTIKNLLTLKEISICKNIKNRNPVGVKNIFLNTVDSIYCFTKIENLGPKKEVRHVWFYENQIMTQVRYNVKKANLYRSWTKKTISSFQIGNWRVEVQDKNGTILGSKRFKIKKST